MLANLAHRLYRKLWPLSREWRRAGARWSEAWPQRVEEGLIRPAVRDRSSLEAFFDARTEGPGIWKWRHYFDIYHRHFKRLRERDNLVILEIGIYSGGSLEMWRDYFGPTATIYGVDIEPSCRRYERPGTHILIGDQADRSFWRRVLADGSLPAPDVVIDDGGHTPEQQRVTLEELLPRLRAGGVYVCEDIYGRENAFAAFVSGLADRLNGMDGARSDETNPERRMTVPANNAQASLHSVHLYPYVVVIETHEAPVTELVAPKQGSQWEPFLR